MAKRSRKSSATLVWRGITCRVRHQRDYLSQGWSHIEILVMSPKGVPLPITETGYRSHFLDERELASAGGPVAFVEAWLDQEARSKAYAKAVARYQQLDLFAPEE